jgi:hypothetical protein
LGDVSDTCIEGQQRWHVQVRVWLLWAWDVVVAVAGVVDVGAASEVESQNGR